MAKWNPPGSGGKKEELFSREAREESDPAWQQWFFSVERHRIERSDPGRKPIVISRAEKENGSVSVIRRVSEPSKLKTLLKKEGKKSGRNIAIDLELLTIMWNYAVDKEYAEATEIYSFKNGVLTISVFSSTIFQEIRQFHKSAILEELRAIWQMPIPLLKVVYKLGKN